MAADSQEKFSPFFLKMVAVKATPLSAHRPIVKVYVVALLGGLSKLRAQMVASTAKPSKLGGWS